MLITQGSSRELNSSLDKNKQTEGRRRNDVLSRPESFEDISEERSGDANVSLRSTSSDPYDDSSHGDNASAGVKCNGILPSGSLKLRKACQDGHQYCRDPCFFYTCQYGTEYILRSVAPGTVCADTDQGIEMRHPGRIHNSFR
ncbi:hypothetical protein HMI54_015168 [Coelomomyces lativittatus]|nr:hypothetical protein HMI55_001363 [Coelomomyces lativittatus]KAJ1513201.1 hypothetical protein HMI54_015168 [Coelomomyces lativittatus]KAJ1515352.1 hypothetical protein HMI56_005439 [Coelomomyces lativittatus]